MAPTLSKLGTALLLVGAYNAAQAVAIANASVEWHSFTATNLDTGQVVPVVWQLSETTTTAYVEARVFRRTDDRDDSFLSSYSLRRPHVGDLAVDLLIPKDLGVETRTQIEAGPIGDAWGHSSSQGGQTDPASSYSDRQFVFVLPPRTKFSFEAVLRWNGYAWGGPLDDLEANAYAYGDARLLVWSPQDPGGKVFYAIGSAAWREDQPGPVLGSESILVQYDLTNDGLDPFNARLAYYTQTIAREWTSPVPEPSTWVLSIAGLLAVAFAARYKGP
jgi:hypothetical protein